MKPETFNRSRIEILNYIICFSTCTMYGKGAFSFQDEKHAFISSLLSYSQIFPIGSLIKLSSAPFSKFYLSWLVEIKDGNNRFDQRFLLKSIEDGSLCWWSNVSISAYSEETLKNFPQWRWNDEQWAFKDRWFRACKGAFGTLPKFPEFLDNGGVILSTRKRWDGGVSKTQKTFPSWKKLKSKEMSEYFKSCES